MPTVARVGKFKIVINTKDHNPAHVHVIFDDCNVRIYITANGVRVGAFVFGKPKGTDEAHAAQAVAENLEACLAKWKEIYG